MTHARVERPHLPRFPDSRSRYRVLSDDEINLIADAMTRWRRYRERDLFYFLVDTGARPYSEACRLKWHHVWDRKVTFVTTKNGTDRTLPLTPRAWDAVERQRDRGLDGPWTDIRDGRMVKLWHDIRLEIPSLKDTVLYSCRHTCASRQVAKGVDLYRVMNWMGHKSYQTTMGYAHLAPGHLLENLEALS